MSTLVPGAPYDGPPWHGGPVGERAVCVLAPNPGPMTLDGTNTWLLAEPGAGLGVVVDPGPDHPGHRAAVLAAAERRDVRVAVILLTHGHPDHSEGARALADATGAPVLALDPAHRLGDEGLAGGDVLRVGGLHLRVVATPGHTGDSLSFLLPAEHAVLTGDTVLGRGTTVVIPPDGRLADYLESLRLLAGLSGPDGVRQVLPGHGPVLDDAAAVVAGYLAHRVARLDQVRSAVAALGADPAVDPMGLAARVVEVVYADVPRSLWPAAELSVQAQLQYLADDA